MIIDYPGLREPIKRRSPLTNHERRHELQINFSQQIDAKYRAGLSIMILFQIRFEQHSTKIHRSRRKLKWVICLKRM